MNSRMLKEMAHSYFPAVLRAYNAWVGRHYRAKPIADVFSEIHRNNHFKGTESICGPGSGAAQTEKLRRELPRFLERHGVKSLLDAPCGDLNWMLSVLEQYPVDYTGADIVGDLIRSHTEKFWSKQMRFIQADVTRDPLPRVDVTLCRDCLVHLSNELAVAALQNFRRSGTRFLLTTHYPATRVNVDIVPGMWRALNLQVPPFSMPAPVDLIVEECTEANGSVADKTLALFELTA
jgi:SAM-dependent methyltransferase